MKKTCKDCLFILDPSEFYDYKRSIDGKRRSCKKCMGIASAKGYASGRDKALKAEKAAKDRTENRVEDKPTKKTQKKRCFKCDDYKLLNEFHVNAKGTYQRHSTCKVCSSILKKVKPKKVIDLEAIDRIKKIMSVPVNPKYTQEYYIMQNFTPRSMSNLGAVSQVSKASEMAEKIKWSV